MTWYRSSLVSLSDKNCPAAFAYGRRGTYRDRKPMGTGVAVHAFAERTAADPETPPAEVADGVQVELVAGGRCFEGGPVEHYSPADIQAGRDLAMLWLDRDDGQPPEGAEIHPELSVSLDRDWQKCERDSKEERWRQALDLAAVYVEWDESQGQDLSIVEVRDYKGWDGSDAWFETTQGRAAAICAGALVPEADIIRRVCVNYRLRRPYVDEIDLRYDEGADKLDGYREGLRLTLIGLDRYGIAPGDLEDPAFRQLVDRLAVPGVGCMKGYGGCPFLAHCEPALRHFTSLAPPWQDPADIARLWTIAQALGRRAGTELRAILSEDEPIQLAAGKVGDMLIPAGEVGLKPSGRRAVTANAGHWIGREWAEKVAKLDEGSPEAQLVAASIETLFKVSKPGVGVVGKILRHIKRTVELPKGEFEALEARCIESAPNPKLTIGAWKV